MALNYKSSSQTASALTAATNGDAIDLRGYSRLAVQIKFGTCTGTTNTSTLLLQTSNDNSNWITIVQIASETDCVDYDSDDYFSYVPDYATAGDGGFGRYVRIRLTGTGTFSVSYTMYYEAKE